MYASFFGLQRAPFPTTQGAAQPYLCRRHSDVLAHLLLRIQSDEGVVLVTTSTSRANTAACRYLVDQAPDNCRVGFSLKPGTDNGWSACLRSICDAFRIPRPPGPADPAAVLALLKAEFLRSLDADNTNVLILGQAQEWSDEALEHLASLDEPNPDEPRLLQVILVAQPNLQSRLKQAGPAGLARLAQRIVAEYAIDNLNAGETTDYIAHQFRAAGLKGALPFSDKALLQIHALTQGVPEQIDAVCTRALSRAHALNKHLIDHKIVAASAQPTNGLAVGAPRPPKTLWPRIPRPTAAIVLGVAAALALAFGIWWVNGSVSIAPVALKPAVKGVPLDLQAAPKPTAPNGAEPVVLPTSTLPEAIPARDQTPVVAEPPVKDPANHPDFATLKDGPSDTWPALGKLWGIKLGGKTACEDALRARHQCFRSTDMTLKALKDLDRPGLVRLDVDGIRRWVLLRFMDNTQVTLSSSGLEWTMPVGEFSAAWKGAYSSIWRLPPGQTAQIFSANERDRAGQWLNAQLKRLQSRKLLPKSADTLAARVRVLQRRHGLKGDGRAVPSTFLIANRLVGVPEPRLIQR